MGYSGRHSVLTIRERAVLDAVKNHYDEHGKAPSPRNIIDALGLENTSQISRQITRLVSFGCLKREGPSHQRTIHLISLRPTVLQPDLKPKPIPKLTKQQKLAWFRDILGFHGY